MKEKFVVKKLNNLNHHRFNKFIEKTNEANFYHTLKYLTLIEEIDQSNTFTNHLIVQDNDEIIAFMPIFIFKGEYGNVINSSPFYGSHGGIIKLNSNDSVVDNILLDAFDKLYKKYNCISSTIIEKNSFNYQFNNNEIKYKFNLIDSRISLFNILPDNKNENEISVKIIDNCHKHHKRILNKYLKISNEFKLCRNTTTMKELWNIHKGNMARIGGKYKPLHFFEKIEKIFDIGKEYDIYSIKKGDLLAATLLIFYFKDTVEYFTPAINEDFRKYQPLNFLIYETMIDVVKRKDIKIWNWGGTWNSQEGLYTYKKRWGAKESSYKYYINCNLEFLKNYKQEEIIENYPNYYLVPFNKI